MKSLLIAVLFVSAVLFQMHNVQRLGFDGENTTDEVDSLYGLHAARTGQPLYRDFRVLPHIVVGYMPLFYWLPAAAARAADANMLQTFVVGRGYVYLSWLGVAVLIYRLARDQDYNAGAASIGALLWLAGSLAVENAISFKPDAPALMLSLLALWLYRRGPGLAAKSGAVLALVLAFFHRHSAVAVLAVLLAEELRQRRYRAAALLLGAWVVLVGGPMALMQAMSGGAFALNIQGVADVGADWPRWGLIIRLAAARGGAAFVGAVIAVAVVRDNRSRLLRWYFLTASILALATSWKFGAGTNYFLEPFAAACVLAPALLVEATCPVWLRACWLAVALVTEIPVLATRLATVGQRPGVGWADFGDCVRDLPGPMLSEDGYLALRHDGAPVLLNASSFSAMRQRGKFDDTAVLQQIDAGAFGAIVTTAPVETIGGFRHFPSHWLAAIGSHYELARACAGGSLYVYLPRNRLAK